eukprot:gene332-343_t
MNCNSHHNFHKLSNKVVRAKSRSTDIEAFERRLHGAADPYGAGRGTGGRYGQAVEGKRGQQGLMADGVESNERCGAVDSSEVRASGPEVERDDGEGIGLGISNFEKTESRSGAAPRPVLGQALTTDDLAIYAQISKDWSDEVRAANLTDDGAVGGGDSPGGLLATGPHRLGGGQLGVRWLRFARRFRVPPELAEEFSSLLQEWRRRTEAVEEGNHRGSSTRVEREIEFLKRAERSTAIDRDTGGRGGGGVKKRPRVEAVKFPYKRFLPNTLATELPSPPAVTPPVPNKSAHSPFPPSFLSIGSVENTESIQ